MLIKKIHFSDIVKFNQNVDDEDVNPCIKDAEKYDFIPKFGTSLIAPLAAACVASATWTAWAAGTYNTAGQIVTHNDKVYILNTATTTAEPGINSHWLLKEMYTLWLAHVKPFMVYNAFARFLVEHGIEIAQSGLRVAFEDTSNEVDAKTKAMKVNAQKGKASMEHNLLLVALADANWTFDGTEYAQPTNGVKRGSSKKFGFNSI
jgi:hypothetical protein